MKISDLEYLEIAQEENLIQGGALVSVSSASAAANTDPGENVNINANTSAFASEGGYYPYGPYNSVSSSGSASAYIYPYYY